MTNGVLPCHVSAYKSYMPLTFDGGSSSLCKSLFTPGDFISRAWNGCILVQKTVAKQSVDYSCLFLVMSGNARITLMVRTVGTVYLALRSSSGDVQRICQTTAVPTLGNVMHIGYSWDGSRLALSVYDTTAKTIVQVVESSTNITSLPAWTEEDGIYVGNRADLSLPYKGNIYGGTFGYGVALSGASMAREAAAGNMAFGTRFIIHPQVMGLRGTGIIREPNHHDITVLNPDKTAFWNSNVPSSVIQEWWRFIPTIADIPQGAVVLDTDGVVKKCVYVFNNAGTDLVNCGVLPYLENIRENNLPITIECVFAQNAIGPFAAPVAWGGIAAETNMAIKVRNSAIMWGAVGDTSVVGTATIAANVFVRAKVARNAGNMSLCYNGKAYARVFTNTLAFPSKSLLIGGHSNSENIEGPIAKVRVYSGYSAACDVSDLVMLDEWDFNKWDGSASGLSNMGHPYSVTKASPFTELVKALVPVSML